MVNKYDLHYFGKDDFFKDSCPICGKIMYSAAEACYDAITICSEECFSKLEGKDSGK